MKRSIVTTCDAIKPQAFLNDELSIEAEERLLAHLESCEKCRARLINAASQPELSREIAQALRDQPGDSVALCSRIQQQANLATTATAQIEQVVRLLEPTDDPTKLGRIGGYEVAGVVGSGGMGAVLKAVDPALDRVIAIKVLSPHLATTGAARKRFAREAKAAAAVIHPNVIAIHSVCNEGKLPYLVMPYIHGSSLQKRIDREGALPLVDILRVGAQVAAGLAAAHEQGLVHRDIKPANILLEEGVERVAITDFGLARAVDDATLTQTGMIAGTPQYMSPEQARGEPIDVRSDLFSLGSVLYAMCTGRPPFRAETSYGVLRGIIETDPRSIREINVDAPEWLCEIINRLMSKHPSGRLESASQVAVLLNAWLAHLHQPETKPAPKRIKPVPKRIKPAPNAQGLQWRKSNFLLRVAFGAGLVLAGLMIWPGMDRGAHTTGGDKRSDVPLSTTPAQWRPPYIDRIYGNYDLHGDVRCVAYSSDGKTVYTAGDSVIQVRDAETGKLIDEFREHFGTLETIAVSPDGTLLAGGGIWGELLWDIKSRELKSRKLFSFGGSDHRPGITNVAFSPDGKRLVRCRRWRIAEVLDSESGELIKELPLTEEGRVGIVIPAVDFSPSGDLLAITGDSVIHLFDAQSLELIRTIQAHQTRDITTLEFVSDEALLSSGAESTEGGVACEIKLWEPRTGNLIRRFDIGQISKSPPAVRVLPQRDKAIAELQQSLAVIDLSTGTTIRTITVDETPRRPTSFGRPMAYHHENRIAVAPDGRQIAIADSQQLQLIDLETGARIFNPNSGHDGALTGLAPSPDGDHLATIGEDGRAIIWNSQTGEFVKAFTAAPENVTPQHIFWPANAGTIYVTGKLSPRSGSYLAAFDAQDHNLLFELTFPWDIVSGSTSLSASGKELALVINNVGYTRTLLVIDAHTGETIHELKSDLATQATAFSADGSCLLTIVNDRRTYLLNTWDLHSEQVIGSKQLGGEYDLVRLSPDGELVATAKFSRNGREVSIVDSTTLVSTHDFYLHLERVAEASFSAGRIITMSRDSTDWPWHLKNVPYWIRLRDAREDGVVDVINGGFMLTHDKHVPPVSKLQLSADGKRLFGATTYGVAVSWDMSARNKKSADEESNGLDATERDLTEGDSSALGKN